MLDQSTKIERMERVISMIDQLKPEQFDYSQFVSESQNRCGTVCCVAGWFPKYIPDGPLEWGTELDDESDLDIMLLPKRGTYDMKCEVPIYTVLVHPALEGWHDLSFFVINYLYFGQMEQDEEFIQDGVTVFNKFSKEDVPGGDHDDDLMSVRARFTFILEKLKQNKL